MDRAAPWSIAILAASVTSGVAAAQTAPPDEDALGPAAPLTEFWTELYGQVVEEAAAPAAAQGICLPKYDISLLEKAQPDECFYGQTDICYPRSRASFNATYPGSINQQSCIDSGGEPKVNQSYVWGLTKSDEDHIWYATAANVLCLVTTGFLDVQEPYKTDSVVCQAGCPGVPIDARPPRFYAYDRLTNTLDDLTLSIKNHDAASAATLQLVYGIRSAGSSGDVVFFGGLKLTGGVTIFAFDAATKEYLGFKSFAQYNNIRQWLLAKGSLYTGFGKPGGGEIVRWTGSLGTFKSSGLIDDLIKFETVGDLKGDPAYLILHKDNLMVSTWGGDAGMGGQGLLLYLSPPLGSDNTLTSADVVWQEVWKLSDYEVEPFAFQVGGALASMGDYVVFGTMQVPALGALLFCGDVGCPTSQDTLAAFLGTLRPIQIFRGRDFGTAEQQVDVLYGSALLPKYDASTASWILVPNKLGAKPLFGLAGINNLFNTYTWWAEAARGGTYFGTFDWSFLLADFLSGLGDVTIPPEIQDLAENFYGADLWRFVSPLMPALPVSLNGVGNYTNYGIRTMLEADSDLFIGTANPMNLLTDPQGPIGGWELRRLHLTDTCGGCGEVVWNPLWQQANANEWWVEYKITNGTVRSAYLEVPGKGNVPLTYEWSKWVGSPNFRIRTGSQVILHAESKLGARAQTNPFAYLVTTQPQTNVCPEGDVVVPPPPPITCYSPSITQGSGANEWWAEYKVSDTAATAVSLEIVGKASVTLSYQWSKWVGPSDVRIPRGTQVIVHVTSGTKTAKTVAFGYLVTTAPTLAPCP